jgi:hypothetical protein
MRSPNESRFESRRSAARPSRPALLALALIVAHSVPGHADTIDRLIEQGVALRTQGKPEEALDLFAKAHALAPSARTLAQMGLAEGALHRWVPAEEHVVAALAAHDTPWIENSRNRDALEQALSSIRAHIGVLNVVGPPGAEVTANGKPIGRLPLGRAVRLAEGPAHIEGTAAGYVSASTSLQVVGGIEATILLQMPPVPAPPAAIVAPPPRPDDEPSTGRRWKTWTGASLIAASAAALGTGIAWLAIDGDPSCGTPAGAVCHHLYDTKTQGWVAVGAGVAGGVAGGLLIWSGLRSSAGVAVGPGTLRLVGRF